MSDQKQADKTATKKAVKVDPATGTVAAERTPAPERLNPAASVHTDEKSAEQAEADRKAAVAEATKGVPEGQATTVAPPPVEDPERKPYQTTTSLGYRPGRSGTEVDVNAQPPEADRKFSIASRARWGETSAAELRKERRKIDERIRKQTK